jgi:hypothetical protein
VNCLHDRERISGEIDAAALKLSPSELGYTLGLPEFGTMSGRSRIYPTWTER